MSINLRKSLESFSQNEKYYKKTMERKIIMKNENRILKDPADYDYLKASSAQDCTGLIPKGIAYEEEIENYEELYSFLPHAVINSDH